MNKNTLLLIDLTKNFNLSEKNHQYIYLNRGNIDLNNCKQIKLKDFYKLRQKNYNYLLKYFKRFILKNQDDKFFLSEMEIFNLRNDRYEFPDRILNFLVVKEIILKKKIKKIKIISDNKYTFKIFDQLNIEIEKKDFSENNLRFNFINLKIIKFLFKALILIIFLKFFKRTKKNIYKSDNFYVSLYPNKYFYGKENLFEKKNICNFLMSDETHLNLNLRQLLRFARITSDRNMVNLEGFIKISDILILIFKHLINMLSFRGIKKFEIKFNKLNFYEEFKDFFIGSYINRSKLEIYSKAIPRFLKSYNVSKINLYLFEYSFGFYLMRKIRQYSKEIKISGFQHGIFSNNLMWFDVINTLKFRKMYIPNNIFCLNKFSLKDYKSKYKKIKIQLVKTKTIKKNFDFINSIKITKKSDKILVLPGLHDVTDLYFYAKNTLISDSKKIFYFKLHPKNKFNFVHNTRLKSIVNFEKINFSKVIISQDSSLHFDFLISKRNFSVIDFDYKQNIISTNLNNNKKIKFLKY